MVEQQKNPVSVDAVGDGSDWQRGFACESVQNGVMATRIQKSSAKLNWYVAHLGQIKLCRL